MAHGDHLKYQAKPKAGRQTLFRLTSYLVCDRLLLSVIGVLIVLSIAANLGGSYLLRPIINRYIIPGDFLGLGKMLGILTAIVTCWMPLSDSTVLPSSDRTDDGRPSGLSAWDGISTKKNLPKTGPGPIC